MLIIPGIGKMERINCIAYQAIKKIKDSQDQKCADIIHNVINGASRSAAAPLVKGENKALVLAEFFNSFSRVR